eukprot:8095154-Pyramimonas_sp.AAC.1
MRMLRAVMRMLRAVMRMLRAVMRMLRAVMRMLRAVTSLPDHAARIKAVMPFLSAVSTDRVDVMCIASHLVAGPRRAH